MIIQNILSIEKNAQANLSDSLKKEHELLTQQLEDKFAQRLQALTQSHQSALETLAHSSQAETEAVIYKIQADYAQKGDELTDIFAQNYLAWKEDLKMEVLNYGSRP